MAKSDKQPLLWPARLRQAIDLDDRTRYAIAQAAGIEQSLLSRFMGGDDCRLATAEKLARVVGLDLTETTSKQPRNKGKESGRG